MDNLKEGWKMLSISGLLLTFLLGFFGKVSDNSIASFAGYNFSSTDFFDLIFTFITKAASIIACFLFILSIIYSTWKISSELDREGAGKTSNIVLACGGFYMILLLAYGFNIFNISILTWGTVIWTFVLFAITPYVISKTTYYITR